MPEVALSPLSPTEIVIFRASGSEETSSGRVAVTVTVVAPAHSFMRLGLRLRDTFVLVPASLSVIATDVSMTVALVALPSIVSDSDAPSYNLSSTGVRVNVLVPVVSPARMVMLKPVTAA